MYQVYNGVNAASMHCVFGIGSKSYINIFSILY